MANLTFDFTPAMGTDSADKLGYALRSVDVEDTIHVRVSAPDTDRIGPIIGMLESKGYGCTTKGDPSGGLDIMARKGWMH